MKQWTSVGILIVLVFGVGWTSRVLKERMSGSSRPTPAADDSRSRPGSRTRYLGPFLTSVTELADELDLSPTQRGQLDDVIAETTREVARREGNIRAYLHRTRAKVRGLLTEPQLRKLDELNRKHWADYRAAKVRKGMSWLRRETSLDDATLAHAEKILQSCEDERGRCFREFDWERPWEDLRASLEALTRKRNEQLGELLGADLLERFLRSGVDRWEAEEKGRGAGDESRDSWSSPSRSSPAKTTVP